MSGINAIQQVLDTPELLENILLQMSMKDLLHAQRVCMRWSTLIKRSRPLQRALFLGPSDEAIDPYELYSHPEKTLKFLYRASFRRWTVSDPPKPIRFELNPLLIKFQPDISNLWHDSPTPLLKCFFEFASCKQKQPGASWRRMFLCWPPLKAMKIDPVFVRNSSGEDIVAFEITREEGIRVADILSEIIKRAQ
jgi:hypothetical protein